MLKRGSFNNTHIIPLALTLTIASIYTQRLRIGFCCLRSLPSLLLLLSSHPFPARRRYPSRLHRPEIVAAQSNDQHEIIKNNNRTWTEGNKTNNKMSSLLRTIKESREISKPVKLILVHPRLIKWTRISSGRFIFIDCFNGTHPLAFVRIWYTSLIYRAACKNAAERSD
ncbi:unnamed protein product [Lactuca virosa]|uniref:Uncharacterized protein n=1 Tax=Lactuca virosa TaxID=75947 RepID=A0AAU9NXG6_9ASTR|nr:unnamed protein product [Lactuca virosa]